MQQCTDIDMTKKYLVGVYGTLKKTYGNHYIINDAEYRGEGKVNAIMIKFKSYPGAIAFRDIDANSPLKTFAIDNWIRVEVYEVTGKQLASMDRLESHPHWYERKLIHVHDGSFQGEAWVYFLNPKTYLTKTQVVVVDGIWNGSSVSHTRCMLVDFGDGNVKPKIIRHTYTQENDNLLWSPNSIHSKQVANNDELAEVVLDVPSKEEEEIDTVPDKFELGTPREVRSA